MSSPPPGKCICSTFAQVCNLVGTMATIKNYLNPKPAAKNLNTLSESYLKVTLLLGCNQGVSPPPGKCICSTFAQVCNPVGTVATIMRNLNPKPAAKNLNTLSEFFFKVTLLLGWNQGVLPTPWKVHLQHFCTSLQPCGHNGHYKKLFKSKTSSQKLEYIK